MYKHTHSFGKHNIVCWWKEWRIFQRINCFCLYETYNADILSKLRHQHGCAHKHWTKKNPKIIQVSFLLIVLYCFQSSTIQKDKSSCAQPHYFEHSSLQLQCILTGRQVAFVHLIMGLGEIKQWSIMSSNVVCKELRERRGKLLCQTSIFNITELHIHIDGFAIPLCCFQTTNIFVAGPVGGHRVLFNIP